MTATDVRIIPLKILMMTTIIGWTYKMIAILAALDGTQQTLPKTTMKTGVKIQVKTLMMIMI
jgi:hypothetical protein